mmetsp:Transcript_66481/g.185815  ORF Transcript_66481/g.185815 Transcript_66481/m.185815 type:complete len:268 (+) Transcript_66481:337-1140(+)
MEKVAMRSCVGKAFIPDAMPLPGRSGSTSSCRRSPEAASQTVTLPLLLMVATRSPLLSTATSSIQETSAISCRTSQVRLSHTTAFRSKPPVITLSPPGNTAALEMGAVCRLSSQMPRPVEVSQMVAHCSKPQPSTRPPSGNMDTPLVMKPKRLSGPWYVGGTRVCSFSPVVAFQTMRVDSPAHVTTRPPSGKTSAHSTLPLWGSSTNFFPSTTSQIVTTGSLPKVSTRSPLGKKRTPSISDSCANVRWKRCGPQRLIRSMSVREAMR